MAITNTTNGQLDAQIGAPKYGTLIPNRIFVGGIRWAMNTIQSIDQFVEVGFYFSSLFFALLFSIVLSGDTTEAELCRVFSSYGNVKSTKIIVDRAGVSKGYGFVTFETEQEAQRLQADVRAIANAKNQFNTNF